MLSCGLRTNEIEHTFLKDVKSQILCGVLSCYSNTLWHEVYGKLTISQFGLGKGLVPNMYQANVWKWCTTFYEAMVQVNQNELIIITFVSEYITINTYHTAFLLIVSCNIVSVWPVWFFAAFTYFCCTMQPFHWKMDIIWVTDMELINPFEFLAPIAFAVFWNNFNPRNQTSKDSLLVEIVWLTVLPEGDEVK